MSRRKAGSIIFLIFLTGAMLLPSAALAAGREGELIPMFKATDIDGKPVVLKDAAVGRKVVLFFWNSYITMSINEMKYLNELQQKYGSRSLAIIAIPYKGGDSQKVKEELEKLAIIGTVPEYPVITDPGGSLTRQYRVKSAPQTFIVDRRGEILFHFEGFTDDDRESLNGRVKELLGLVSVPLPPPVRQEKEEPAKTSGVSAPKSAGSLEQQAFQKNFYFANYYYNLGDMEKAMDYYLKCLEITPDAVNVHIVIGEIHASRKDLRLARESWEKALKLDPANKEADAKLRSLLRGAY